MLVYKLTFPDGMIYIGATSNLPQRLQQHSNTSKPYPIYMNQLVQRFGWDNITHTIIKNDLPDSEAKDLEIELKKKYEKEGILVNKMIVDSNGFTKKTPEQKEHLRKVNSGENSPHWNKRGSAHPKSRAVIQYSLDNVFIAEFDSLSLASEVLSIGQPSITFVCNGTNSKTHGFKFRYKDEIINEKNEKVN